MGYVFTDTGNTITLNWDGHIQSYVDGQYQGYLWTSGLFDPGNKASRGAGAGTNNVQVEIGPLVKPNTGPLDAGSPWVMCGVRVGGWIGPSGDCVGQIFTRYTQVIQQ
jgi:hypothetical protein